MHKMEQQEREILEDVVFTLNLIEEVHQKINIDHDTKDANVKRGQLDTFRATLEKSVRTYSEQTINKEPFYRYKMLLTNPPQTAEDLRATVVTKEHKNDDLCCTCKLSVALKKKHTCRLCSATTCNSNKCFASIPFNEINTNPRYRTVTYKVLLCKVCEESAKRIWPNSLKMFENIEEYVLSVKETLAKILHGNIKR